MAPGALICLPCDTHVPGTIELLYSKKSAVRESFSAVHARRSRKICPISQNRSLCQCQVTIWSFRLILSGTWFRKESDCRGSSFNLPNPKRLPEFVSRTAVLSIFSISLSVDTHALQDEGDHSKHGEARHSKSTLIQLCCTCPPTFFDWRRDGPNSGYTVHHDSSCGQPATESRNTNDQAPPVLSLPVSSTWVYLSRDYQFLHESTHVGLCNFMTTLDWARQDKSFNRNKSRQMLQREAKHLDSKNGQDAQLPRKQGQNIHDASWTYCRTTPAIQ